MPTIMSPSTRLWARVDKSGECWIWTGARDRKGYGVIGRGGRSGGTVLAHRLSWEIEHGAIPDRKYICHRCDNPPCVRPDHLFIGTPKQNSEDMVEKGRSARGIQKPNTRLTAETAREILRRYEDRQLVASRTTWGDPNSMTALAKEFGIHPTTVHDLVNRKTWKHL